MLLRPRPIHIDDELSLYPLSLEHEGRVRELIEEDYDFLAQWVYWVAPDYIEKHLHQDTLDAIERFKKGTQYSFAMYWRGEMVGVVDAHNIIDQKEAEIGYWLIERARGYAIAPRSAEKLINLLREECGIPFVYLEVSKANEASIRVAEKLGFTRASEHRNEEYGVDEYRYERVLSKV